MELTILQQFMIEISLSLGALNWLIFLISMVWMDENGK
jgi:hypothetical protein